MLGQSRLAARIAPIKSMMQTIRTAANPSLAMQQMLNNPQYAQVTKLIQDSGGDPQKAFYSLANQLGVDPQQILNELQS